MSSEIKMIYEDVEDLDLSFCDLFVREDPPSSGSNPELDRWLRRGIISKRQTRGFLILPFKRYDYEEEINNPNTASVVKEIQDFSRKIQENLDSTDIKLIGTNTDACAIVSYDPSDYKEEELYRLYWPILDLAIRSGRRNVIFPIFDSINSFNANYVETFTHLNSYPDLDKVNIFIIRDRVLDGINLETDDPLEILENKEYENMFYPDVKALNGRNHAEELKRKYRREKEKEEILEKYPDFSSYLFYLINKRIEEDETKNIPEKEKIKKYSNVYNNVLMDRRHFSKLQNKDYHPGKRTVLQLILGAKLDLEDATELMKKAGYVFDPQDDTDYLITCFIEDRIYDIVTINETLEAHHLEPL